MTDENVLQEAERLIYGPRQASYGHPYDDFSKTGQMWGAILKEWRSSGEPNVPPELVGLCQIAVKISREVNAHKRDNIVDIAGYAGTVALVRERQASSFVEWAEATLNDLASKPIDESVSDACEYCDEARCLDYRDHEGPHSLYEIG